MALAKIRRSEQRDMIRDEVYSRCDHPTAEAVYEALRTKAPNLSLGTVYRNLNLLSELGVILRVPVPGQPDHFDRTTYPHCHFRCNCCNTVLDLPMAPPVTLPDAQQSLGCQITGFDLLFNGLCPNCSEKV